jgi:antitoxin MazE
MNRLTRSIKSKIVRIGNSQGIRIPHTLLPQLHLTRDVEITVQDDQLVIRAAHSPRDGWEERFARAASLTFSAGLEHVAEEPALDNPEFASEWDGSGWTW